MAFFTEQQQQQISNSYWKHKKTQMAKAIMMKDQGWNITHSI